jgi:hypothetical protein
MPAAQSYRSGRRRARRNDPSAALAPDKKKEQTTMDAAPGLQQLVDRHSILDVLERLARGYDIPDMPQIVSCFTADCQYEIGDHLSVGRHLIVPTVDDLIEARKRSLHLDGFDRCTHVVSGVDIELQGDRATVENSMTGHLIGRRGDECVMVVRHVRHYDEMVRDGQGWLIAKRRHELQWAFETTAISIGNQAKRGGRVPVR